MAQGVDTALLTQPGGIAGGTVQTLGLLDVDGSAAQAVGKQPDVGMMALPVEAQGIEQARREQGVTILAAFAVAHLETHAVRGALDVGQFQGTNFPDPQARRVGGHQERAAPQGPCRRKQALHFLARKHAGQMAGHLGHGNVQVRMGSPQHPLVQEAEGAHRLVDAGVGEVPGECD